MYCGLFGDLPAAKGQASQAEEDDKNNKGQTASTTIAQSSETDKAAIRQEPSAPLTLKNKQSPMMLLPPTAARKKAKPSAAAPSSFSQTIGKAGASMAFVPAALQRKKRPSRFAKLLESPKGTVDPAAAATTTVDTAGKLPVPIPPAASAAATTTTTAPLTSSVEETSTFVVATSFVPATASVVQASLQSGPIDIHAPQHYQGQLGAETAEVAAPMMPPPPKIQGNAAAHLHHHQASRSLSNTNEALEGDDEPAEITDPYDPYVPNDLLQYWDRQALVREQRQMEEETLKALEQQQIIREQLEQERQALLQQQQQGDISQLAAAAGGMGRGRGRGLSNLPAWLVAKQQQQQQGEEKARNGEDALGNSV